MYAHSLPGRPALEWEPLSRHLTAVGDRAAGFAAPFGWAEAARVAGRLHDIGKCSAAFQAYIRGEQPRGGDHSTAGAREATAAYPALAKVLAFIIAGHHAGLADAESLLSRLHPGYLIPAFAGWEVQTGVLLPEAALAPTRRPDWNQERGFGQAFLIRMLFSCLVDADFLETERFYLEAKKDKAETKDEHAERGGHLGMTTLRDRLRAHMAEKRAGAEATQLNALRAEVLDHAIGKAQMQPGLFTLTVPTGGGKTLASLSFALEHAGRHRLSRVVYVIPFTSIIEQTAEVFRRALDAPADILEHHASFDWDRAEAARRDDGEGPDGLAKLRRASENWDAPIVVTTAVQFFESLFANRTSRCRKLHNLAKSVIVLDEAQTLPIPLLRPCMAALDELARNYGASVVLCTATQPALRKIDGALIDKNGRNLG
ncbi:MAG: CRISPR-associated endonuclease Cas3'', partial [Rhizobiales bacterium]|nr:CRISPR-associated endonuclease Cas3'' [Hyphomicrobiales bacterium]